MKAAAVSMETGSASGLADGASNGATETTMKLVLKSRPYK